MVIWQADPAGADWISADALRVEAMDHDVWSLVHDHLGGWLSDPAGIATGNSQTLGELLVGLTICGLAMEFHGSSRPASGADHQIAHIWEMQGLAHENMPVSHGACVAIGTLTILALYDWLLTKETISIDITRRWQTGRPCRMRFRHPWLVREGSHRGSVDRGNKGQIPVRCRSDNAARDAGFGLAASSQEIAKPSCSGFTDATDAGRRWRGQPTF